jgi:surface antigen
MPCAHAPYATDGSCANYDWGPARDTAADWRESTTYSPRGYGYRNCTDYVAWRIQQETGRDISGLGNATDWDTTAPRLGLRVLASGQMPAAGDIAQFEGTRSASPGHVAFVEAVHADGSVKVAEYNHDGQGHFDERDNVRADHYIDVNGTSNDHSDTEAGGPSGGMAYAAVSDGQSLYTDEGWAYKKIGGAAFLIGRRDSLDTGKWGVPTGPVSVSEVHDNEAGYSASHPCPPRDYTTVYMDGGTQQWTFFHGRAYPVTLGELADLGAVNAATRVPTYGGRFSGFEIGSPGQLANGTVYRFAGQPRVGQLVQQPDGSWKSFWVSTQTALDCLRLTQQQVPVVIPDAAQGYIENGVPLTDGTQPALCSFPSGWVVHGPGGAEQWRIEGDGSPARPYVRRYFPDQLTLDLNTAGNPQYVQMPTTPGLNGITIGAWMDIPPDVVFVNTANGDEFVRAANAWHKVPWPDMNNCLNITPDRIIQVPGDAVGALPQDAPMSCQLSNRMLAYAGTNYYVDTARVVHAVPNQAVKNCIVGRLGAGPVLDVTTDPHSDYTFGPTAYCPYPTGDGTNFVHEANDPTVYLLTMVDGQLMRQHAGSLCVPDPTTTQLKKYHLFQVPSGELAGIPQGADWFATVASCSVLPGDGQEVHQTN